MSLMLSVWRQIVLCNFDNKLSRERRVVYR